jgi:gamma-glutamylaminecyclotransferase
MIKVFVYGSFMRNGRYHQHYLQGKTFLGKGIIEGYKEYILGGLSGILPEKGERVQGEVYEIDPASLAKLDFFQNYGTAFSRGIVDVELSNGEPLPAEAYIWNGSVGK